MHNQDWDPLSYFKLNGSYSGCILESPVALLKNNTNAQILPPSESDSVGGFLLLFLTAGNSKMQSGLRTTTSN